MLEDDLKSLFIIGKCLLLINFDLKVTRKCNFLITYVIPLCYILLSTYLNYLTIKTLLMKNLPNDTCNTTYFSYMYPIIGIVQHYFNIIYYVLRRNDFKELIESIDNHNERLCKSFREINWKIKIFTILSTIFLLINPLMQIFKYGLKHVLYIVSVSSYLYASILLYLFMYVLLREIKEQFIKINETLVRKDGKVNTLKRIVIAMDFHYKTVKLCKRAEGLFSLPIAVIFMLYLLSATFATHYTLCLIVRKTWEILMYTCICTLIYVIVFISLSIYMWQDVVIQASKTATYIHDIWNNFANRNQIDKNITHLQLMSLQLFNSKLNFTAHGLFPLDWTLLHSMIGAVTTYVIILVQFEMLSPSRMEH